MSDPIIAKDVTGVVTELKKLNAALVENIRLKNQAASAGNSAAENEKAKAVDASVKAIKDYNDSLDSAQKNAIKAGNNSAFYARMLKLVDKASSSSQKAQKKLTTSLEKVAHAVGLTGAAATLFGTRIGQSLLDPTVDAIKAFDSLGEGSANLLARFKSMKGMSVLGPLITALGTTINSLMLANNTLRGYHKILTTVNEANALFGSYLEGAKGQTIQYMKTIENLSTVFGYNASTIRQVGKDLRDVPGAFKELTMATSKLGDTSQTAIGLMNALRGAGLNAADAGRLLTERYTQFGERTGLTVAKQLAKMASAADGVGVSINLARNQIVNASAPLAVFGRKSADAARTWKTFMGSLGDKMPFQEVGKMVSDLTRGISGMSLENRAFLSMVSGFGSGMGALSGGLHMELMLRQEGGLEKNINALMQAVTKFGGGQIITLEQAANTPGLAMQFEVQRRLLGQLIGVQGQGAARMLEALKGVQDGGMSQLDATKTLKDITKRGSQIQQDSMTAQDRTAQILKRTADYTEKLVEIEKNIKNSVNLMAKHLDTNTSNPFTSKNIESITDTIKKAGIEMSKALKDTGKQIAKKASEEPPKKTLQLNPTASGPTINPTNPITRLTATPTQAASPYLTRQNLTSSTGQNIHTLQQSPSEFNQAIDRLIKYQKEARKVEESKQESTRTAKANDIIGIVKIQIEQDGKTREEIIKLKRALTNSATGTTS